MKRVLIADDEPYVLRVLKLTLEKAGYEVILVADGQEALEEINKRCPDVLITDIFMPRIAGRELCTAVRRAIPARDFPILVMTSSTQREEREWVRDLEDIEFLEKPLSPRGLTKKLDELFSKGNTDTKPTDA